MWWRRLLYGSVTIGAFVFYLFNGQWMSWILFLGLLFLPWISLTLSLPAMILTKAELNCPDKVPMNTGITVGLNAKCPLPKPPIRWNFIAHETFSHKKLLFAGNASVLADHCGSIQISLKRAFVYDYLGLIPIPLGRKISKTILILPQPVPLGTIPSLKRYLSSAWKPKPGGGFSENYDLREYVPGDDLRQIHWKLAAKTGKIILREPMIPIRGKLVLSMILNGTPYELDRKFGRLLYLSQYLLEKDISFEIMCLSGDGIHHLPISSDTDLSKGIETLLCLPLSSEDNLSVTGASWHFRIGGEADEP